MEKEIFLLNYPMTNVSTNLSIPFFLKQVHTYQLQQKQGLDFTKAECVRILTLLMEIVENDWSLQGYMKLEIVLETFKTTMNMINCEFTEESLDWVRIWIQTICHSTKFKFRINTSIGKFLKTQSTTSIVHK